MSRTEDLQVALSYADDASPIATFNISGVASALGRLEKDEKRTAIDRGASAMDGSYQYSRALWNSIQRSYCSNSVQ